MTKFPTSKDFVARTLMGGKDPIMIILILIFGSQWFWYGDEIERQIKLQRADGKRNRPRSCEMQRVHVKSYVSYVISDKNKPAQFYAILLDFGVVQSNLFVINHNRKKSYIIFDMLRKLTESQGTLRNIM